MEKESLSIKKEIFPIIIMGFFFVFIHGLALLIIGLFEPAFEKSGDPMNLVVFFAIIIIMTAIILLIAKYWKKQLIQFIILGAVGYTSFYVFWPLYGLVTTDMLSLIFAFATAAFLTIVLFKFPEFSRNSSS